MRTGRFSEDGAPGSRVAVLFNSEACCLRAMTRKARALHWAEGGSGTESCYCCAGQRFWLHERPGQINPYTCSPTVASDMSCVFSGRRESLHPVSLLRCCGLALDGISSFLVAFS